MTDPIAELVDEQLTHTKHSTAYDKCPKCAQSWHGLPRDGCPGPYSDQPCAEPQPNIIETPITRAHKLVSRAYETARALLGGTTQ